MSTIAVITPSKGRKSLINVINHTAGLLREGDMHFVGLDTLAPRYDVATLSNLPKLPLLHAEEMPVLRSVFGNGQRDLLLQLAADKYDWAVFADDDDLLTKEGVDYIHTLEPDDKLHVFKMRSALGSIRTHSNAVCLGNIGSTMLVIKPTHTLPKWMKVNVRESDSLFGTECALLYGVEFHDTIISDLDCA